MKSALLLTVREVANRLSAARGPFADGSGTGKLGHVKVGGLVQRYRHAHRFRRHRRARGPANSIQRRTKGLLGRDKSVQDGSSWLESSSHRKRYHPRRLFRRTCGVQRPSTSRACSSTGQIALSESLRVEYKLTCGAHDARSRYPQRNTRWCKQSAVTKETRSRLTSANYFRLEQLRSNSSRSSTGCRAPRRSNKNCSSLA